MKPPPTFSVPSELAGKVIKINGGVIKEVAKKDAGNHRLNGTRPLSR